MKMKLHKVVAAHKFKDPKEYAKYWMHNGFVTMDEKNV